MNSKLFAPIALVALGAFLLIGGSAVANSEENVANAIGNLAANKFFAVAILAAGGLWLYSTTGHFKQLAG